ncbi:MAG: cytochrome c biogenesis protein CcsA [Bacteroidales bacterium]|jgi:cytochrome c-type biogenesis protein CcsB|nr:cytochrome c biogenesis protein CcsA [Bacteroidales bacterium]
MKKIPFFLLILIVVVLAAATFIEKYEGRIFVENHIYGSIWFVVFWGLLAIISVLYIFKKKMQRNIPVFLLHLSFLIILAGALTTFLTAKRGMLHLRLGEKKSEFTVYDHDGETYAPIPVVISLDVFTIRNYAGTDAPADFISKIRIHESSGNSFIEEVSMNRIFSYKGYRFYQSSYDNDGHGAWLSVNNDPWGITISYIGYFLLLAAMVWTLFSPKGRFQRLLKNPLLKKGVLFAGLSLLYFNSTAQTKSPCTLSQKEAAQFCTLQVLYNNRITPLQTLAYDFTMKLTGEEKYKEYTPEQFFTGWLFYFESWRQEPLLHIKNNDLQKLLELNEYASWNDFFNDDYSYKLQPYWMGMRMGKQSSLNRAIREADEKIQLIAMLRNKTLLQIFPIMDEQNEAIWYSPSSSLPNEFDENNRLFIKGTFSLLQEYIDENNCEQFLFIIDRIKTFQKNHGGISALSESKIKAELIYNRLSIPPILFKVNLFLGLLSLIYFLHLLIRKGRNSEKKIFALIPRIFFILLCFSFFLLTFYIGLRGFISGRLPMSNGYETMILLSWCIMLTTLIFHKKFGLIISFGFLLSGFCLLVASIGRMNPQITHLVPVLSSPLLSLHVSVIMMSYALLAFTFLNGVAALLLRIFRKEDDFIGEQVETLHIVSQLFLYPALFLLGAGIFIGAIWANISWGRYWAWDPKEVWALITFLIYSLALHSGSMQRFRKPLFLHGYMCFAFLTVIMTYLGVNYFLGGMHSYN